MSGLQVVETQGGTDQGLLAQVARDAKIKKKSLISCVFQYLKLYKL